MSEDGTVKLGGELDELKERIEDVKRQLGNAVVAVLEEFEKRTELEVTGMNMIWVEEKQGGGALDPVERKRKLTITLDV